MEKDVWDQLARVRLTLDQTSALIEVNRKEAEEFYIPLAATLLDRLSPPARLLVGIAGPPGCGKTAFAALLAETINAISGEEMAACLGLDGWHFSNAYLDSHFIERGGEWFQLRRIKGAPETYDVYAAYQCLQRIRTQAKVIFPEYSRTLHDPVPDAGVVELRHRIVLAEGNYWLLKEEPWKDFQALFDVTIFLSASPQCLIEGLRTRHRRGAKGSRSVEKHIRQVDLPNIEHVLSNSVNADVVVYKRDSRLIERVVFA